jgi:hypothetical protein
MNLLLNSTFKQIPPPHSLTHCVHALWHSNYLYKLSPYPLFSYCKRMVSLLQEILKVGLVPFVSVESVLL